MTHADRFRAVLLALVVITLVGFALRLFHLNSVSIRGDEVFTIRYWMRQPLAVTLANNATADPQPPLAFALYRVWALLLGDDAKVARFLPALLNTLGIPAIYALVRRLAGWRAGLLAALLWALHPFQVWHAQDARAYAVWSSFSLLALWLSLRAVEKRRWLDWVLYIVVAVAAAYVYYLELFVLAALNLYVFMVYWRQWSLLRRWVLSQLAVAVLLAPWFLQDRLLRGSGYGGTTGGVQVEQLWSRFLTVLNFGTTLPENVVAWLWSALLLVLGWCVVVLWQWRWRAALFALLLGIVPLMLLALVSTRLNVFTPRYVLGAAPAYVLAVASAVGVLCQRNKLVCGAKWLLVLGWLAVSVYSLKNYYFQLDYAKSPDWPSLVSYIEREAAPDDIIVQAAADEALNFYYEEFGLNIDRKQLPANPQQSTDEITLLLTNDMQTHRSIWRVGQTFPDWPSAGVVETWLNDNMQQVRSTSVSGIRTQQYMRWEVSESEIEGASIVSFGGIAELSGWQVIEPQNRSDHVTVWLYWRPLLQSETPLKVFVQLVGALNPADGSPLWSQDDHFPQDGRISTASWTPETLYRDIYTVSLDNVPAGNYTLIAGLYDPETGVRVPVGDKDYIELESLHLF
jgi:mannosyltransferase